jgi:hypothetical protein
MLEPESCEQMGAILGLTHTDNLQEGKFPGTADGLRATADP